MTGRRQQVLGPGGSLVHVKQRRAAHYSGEHMKHQEEVACCSLPCDLGLQKPS